MLKSADLKAGFKKPSVPRLKEEFIKAMPIRRDRTELEEERYVVERENKSASSGVLLGITLAALVGLAGAAFFFMNRGEESPTQILPVPVPNNSQPQSQPQQPSNDTTIIDRTIEKTKEVVPVPQQQAPAPQQQAPSAPEVNINVPTPQNQAPEATTDSPAEPPTQGAEPNTSGSGQ